MFTPLYVRSEYSLLQSSCHLDELIALAKEYGYNNLAITDEGVLHGAIKFYQACKKNQINPIIGLKIPYVINGKTSQLLLYALGQTGYHNLMRISSKYKITGNPIDILDLKNFSLGIAAITSGNESICYNFIKNKDIENLKQHYSILSSVFDLTYLGISLTTKEDKELFDSYYNIFNSITNKLVALTPVFYLRKDDLCAYQVLKSILNNGNLVNVTESEEHSYLLNEDEINELFFKHPDLIINTNNFASKCKLEIEFNHLQLPKFQDGISANQYLLELCIAGLNKRLKTLNNVNRKVYEDRLKYEYQTICDMGFADYFLIVWDYVKYAKNNKIYVGPGRGSAGASLVAYCLGITEIDPIKYNLLFERFLNKERITMPDIDIDFPDDLRDKVIKYVGKKYGASRVAHIATFGTFQIRLAINDCARVYKLSDTKQKQIIKQLNAEIKNFYHNQSSLKDIVETNDVLKQMMDEYDDIKKVLSAAMKIQGLPRNVSTHAAGIIVTKYNLLNYTPLDNGLDDIYQTQYEASDLEALGLLKMDFLGLKNLTNISDTIDLIRKDNPNFVLPKDEDDKETYRMLAAGDVIGVFQLESEGMKKVIMNLKTSSLEDIISALALYRPGPMEMIPHFIARKFGQEEVVYPHPDLKPILKETYGTIVYQEQIMLIACKFAGYSLGKADVLRRAVSKKKKDVLERERELFVSSSMKKGYSLKTANDVYDYIVKFANYGFNKAHSVAYAKVAYITAYLKCHFPTYYFSTLMTSFLGSESDILLYSKEALKKKIPLLSPNINLSQSYFLSYKGSIIFPLTIIKGLGEVKTKELIEERNKKEFSSFKDFIIRTKNLLPISVVYNIIYSGALDDFKITKKAMIENAKLHIEMLDYENMPGIKPINYTNEEYSYGELLEKEKEVLGINIKYNFFLKYTSLYKTKNLKHIGDAIVDSYIKTLGIIKDIKVIQTKNKDDMAFATLEDDVNKIELTLFPRIYNQFLNIKNGMIIIVSGNVSMRNQLQIVVEDIEIL